MQNCYAYNCDIVNCLQRGLNSRPLVYKTSALPLSYRGFVSAGRNTWRIHHGAMSGHRRVYFFISCLPNELLAGM